MREYGDACVYGSFAQVYDTFMDNIDYPQWESYLKGLLQSYGVDGGLVLELGCGTGSMTELLAADGYDMIGVDNSEDMLEIAQEKKSASGSDILYLLQDMREFELYGTVRAVIRPLRGHLPPRGGDALWQPGGAAAGLPACE